MEIFTKEKNELFDKFETIYLIFNQAKQVPTILFSLKNPCTNKENTVYLHRII